MNLEKRLGDPSVILNSFIVTSTPHEAVSWWSDGMTEQEFETHHVYFTPSNTNYLPAILAKATATQ